MSNVVYMYKNCEKFIYMLIGERRSKRLNVMQADDELYFKGEVIYVNKLSRDKSLII